MKKFFLLLLLPALIFVDNGLVTAQTTVHHQESVNGDLSADPYGPVFTLVAGVNRWTGTIEATAPGQADRWVASLPDNFEITAISYSRSSITDGSVVQFDALNPYSQIILGVTTAANSSASFDPPQSITGDYRVEIFTDFNTAGRTWTVDITVQECAPPAEPEMYVQGNGVWIYSNDATPSADDGTDFGSTDVTTGTVDHTFTIYNLGSLALNLTGTPTVRVWGDHAADFSVTMEPETPVPANGSTTFTIRFDPSATGVRAAHLSIDNDDTSEPYQFAIQGAGTFAQLTDMGSMGLTGVYEGSVAWGDYDNDGDLDILLTGSNSSSDEIAKVYQNIGSGFTDISAGLNGVEYSSVAWGDYDNDGDLDILLPAKVAPAELPKFIEILAEFLPTLAQD